MIHVRDLMKRFGPVPAACGINLHIKEREIFGLVGPDGAGKTTLLRMINGLIAPDQGEVSIMAKKASGLDEIREDIGYMPQRFSLYGDLTVMENIRFFGSLYHLSAAIIRQRAEEILELTNMQPFTQRLAADLSGGMKQKLALTCALVTRPRLLLLDEPTYGVDPDSRKEFWKILYRLNKEGKTIVVSTPYMDEAELCHRVAFMEQGTVNALDTPERLRADFQYDLFELEAGLVAAGVLNSIPEVMDAYFYGDKYHLAVRKAHDSAALLQKALLSKGIAAAGTLQRIPPSMEDIFVSLAAEEVG
ncbi:MAG: ABC transporter ATP-binding protein [Clostridia bacterium]|jgi:ABC-2 type transport system ATP-binding protein|nr:ABC transporter ATP-binding protein [Clostridia bacterium]